MAAIYTHKKHGLQINYTVYFPDGSRKSKYRYTSSKTLADLLLRYAKTVETGSRAGNLTTREIAQARHDDLLSEEEARLLSGGKVVELYCLDRILKNFETSSKLKNSPYNHKCTMWRAKNIAKWLRKNPIPNLTIADVKLYAQQRMSGDLLNINGFNGHSVKGVSAKTVNNEIQTLRDLINESIALGMVETNVACEVKVAQKNKKIRRTLRRDEIHKLIESADKNRKLCRGYAYELIMFALFTGMRKSELRTLCWDDVDLDIRKIAVHAKEIEGESDFTPKSGEADTITIPDQLASVIDTMPRNGRFVFGGKKPVGSESIYSAVKKVMARAGLPRELSLHHLRHTFGSWLLKSTGDLKYVQDALRHLDINTTKLYVHTIAEDNDPVKSFGYD